MSFMYLHFSYDHFEVCFMMNLLSSPEREKAEFRWCMVVFSYRSIMWCNVAANYKQSSLCQNNGKCCKLVS